MFDDDCLFGTIRRNVHLSVGPSHCESDPPRKLVPCTTCLFSPGRWSLGAIELHLRHWCRIKIENILPLLKQIHPWKINDLLQVCLKWGAIGCRWRYRFQILACSVLHYSRKKISFMKMRRFSSGITTAVCLHLMEPNKRTLVIKLTWPCAGAKCPNKGISLRKAQSRETPTRDGPLEIFLFLHRNGGHKSLIRVSTMLKNKGHVVYVWLLKSTLKGITEK